MRRMIAAVVAALLSVSPAAAQNSYPTPGGATAPGNVPMFVDPAGNAVTPSQIQGNGTGTTGAVVGTLTSAAGKTAFICGFEVDAIGGTAAVGPITIAGLLGGSQVYQGSSTAAGGAVAKHDFSPCLQASATNTNITVTTTADGTATAVDVNSWGLLVP